MANFRKSPPRERRYSGCPPSPGAPGLSHPHPHPPHACTSAALGAEVKDYNARRFHLASWLLERQDRLGAQRTSAALILALIDIFLATVVILLFFLAALIIVPDWWLPRLLLLLSVLLLLTGSLVAALLALLSAARLHFAGGAPAGAGTGAGVFFHSGGGSSPPLCEAEFQERFRHATQQQMLDGAIAELYNQRRRRARQERWLRWAMGLTFAVVLLLFALTAVWMVLAFIL